MAMPAMLAVMIAAAVLGQAEGPGGFNISWSTIDGGGGTSSGGAFQLNGTIGQPEAGAAMTGSSFTLKGGFWPGTTFTDICPADITGNGFIDVDDLLAVINGWGKCAGPCPPCAPDIAPPAGNCNVDVDDLLAVINAWGSCPS